MAKYRKIYPRIWDSLEFRQLTPDEKLLGFNVLTGTQGNRVGCFVYRVSIAAEETGLESVGTLLDSLCSKMGWVYESTTRVLWIPSWFDWNPPESRDALYGYISDLTELPKLETADRLYNSLSDSLLEYDKIKDSGAVGQKKFSAIWADLYGKARQPVPQPVPHQEQKQKQKQLQNQDHKFFVPAKPKRKKIESIEPQSITSAARAWAIVVKRLHGTALDDGETIAEPSIQAAIKAIGGKQYIESLDSKYLPSIKKDFIAAYNQASKQ